MSITFCIADAEEGATMNLSNANASALLEWIGVAPAPGGSIPARELAALARRRLWPEVRQRGDEGLELIVDKSPGRCTLIDCGRRGGYLQERAAQLLKLAESAGNGSIAWG